MLKLPSMFDTHTIMILNNHDRHSTYSKMKAPFSIPLQFLSLPYRLAKHAYVPQKEVSK